MSQSHEPVPDQAKTNPSNAPAEAFAKLEQRASEYLDGWKRAKADYLNLKKQSEREREDIVGMTMGAVILELLPVKTNLDRAWAQVPADLSENPWVKGVSQVRSQFDAFLSALGIEAIRPDGQTFDPERHEAVERRSDKSVPDNQVMSTLEPGYTMHGKVIVPAKVAVNTHEGKQKPEDTKGGDQHGHH